jgi:hypothetical protein
VNFCGETLLKLPLGNVRRKDNIERDLEEIFSEQIANILSSGKLFDERLWKYGGLYSTS